MVFIYVRVFKYIYAKVDDPSAVVTLLPFLCEKFRVYWSKTISSLSKLDTYIGLIKAGFVWKVISARFLIEHTEFVTRR